MKDETVEGSGCFDEREPLFREEADRLQQLADRAEGLGLSLDDQETLQEAVIAMLVLERNLQEGARSLQVIDLARQIAASGSAKETVPRILEILEMPKATAAVERMILAWWHELETAHVPRRLICDSLNLYPDHHDPDRPHWIQVPPGLDQFQKLEWLGSVVGKRPNALRAYLARAAEDAALRGDEELANAKIPSGWTTK